MSAPPVERFKGKSWEECNEFILAIRTRAMWEGKQQDYAWMADFAATFFWQKAVLWHSRLPQDVRQDWLKLEIALVERWPPPEDDHYSQIKTAPVPAPAPRPSLDCSTGAGADVSRPGVLKVVLSHPNTEYYLDFTSDYCKLTAYANEGIHVRCNILSGTILLERIDHSRPSWLAVHWAGSTPRIGHGSIAYAHISLVDLHTLKSTWGDNRPFQLMTCSIAADGEVTPIWTKDDTSKFTLFPFTSQTNLYLVSDPEAYSAKYSEEKTAKLVFQPTN